MTRPIATITGANGTLGPAVAEELAFAGFAVRALTRAQADICDPEAIRRAIAGSDCVIHLAAKLHIVDPPPSLRDEYYRVNVGGTENVVRAVQDEGVRRLVHASTIAVYGYNDGRLLTEASETRPDTLYGHTKLEAENVAMAADASILRFAAVYGARMKGNYRRLLTSLNGGWFVPIGSGSNRRTVVHERDVARALVLAAQHSAAAGEVFNVTDGSVHTVRELLEAMSLALGRRPPRLAAPIGPIRVAARLLEAVAGAAGVRPPVTRSMINKYVEDVMVSGEKLRDCLGFQPAYDLTRGWQETVEQLRRLGEL